MSDLTEERMQAEVDRYLAEREKFIAERIKLSEEAIKLRFEGLKLDRERKSYPFVLFFSGMGAATAFIGAAVAVVKYLLY
jgi:hypothetical protein